MCEIYPNPGDGERLLFLSLEIGFRSVDFRRRWTDIRLGHTEHYRSMADIIFKDGDNEAIADLLQAWTSVGYFHSSHELLGTSTTCHPLR